MMVGSLDFNFFFGNRSDCPLDPHDFGISGIFCRGGLPIGPFSAVFPGGGERYSNRDVPKLAPFQPTKIFPWRPRSWRMRSKSRSSAFSGGFAGAIGRE